MKVPNLKKIIEPEWAHRVGYGFQGNSERKLDILEQGSTPEDTREVLEKFTKTKDLQTSKE